MKYQNIPNAEKGTIIDVRSEEEFYLIHVEGSINIPLGLLNYYLEELQELPKPWIFCCEEGVRSGWAVDSLRSLGFNNIYNGGGWLEIDHALKSKQAA